MQASLDQRLHGTCMPRLGRVLYQSQSSSSGLTTVAFTCRQSETNNKQTGCSTKFLKSFLLIYYSLLTTRVKKDYLKSLWKNMKHYNFVERADNLHYFEY